MPAGCCFPPPYTYEQRGLRRQLLQRPGTPGLEAGRVLAGRPIFVSQSNQQSSALVGVESQFPGRSLLGAPERRARQRVPGKPLLPRTFSLYCRNARLKPTGT
jgi:hypothetical protein